MSRARQRRRRQPADPPPIPPTPETAARLRRDVIERLFAQGRLRREHRDAAEEIRVVWEAFARGLGPSATDHAALALPGHPARRLYQPIDLLRPAEEIVWRRRYRPWADEARAPCGGTFSVTRLRIVLDVAVDNRPLRQVERAHRLANGAAFAHLRDGLHRYAEIAGWIPEGWEGSG